MSLYATATTDVHAPLALGLTVLQIAHRMGRSRDAVELMLSAHQGTPDRLAA